MNTREMFLMERYWFIVFTFDLVYCTSYKETEERYIKEIIFSKQNINKETSFCHSNNNKLWMGVCEHVLEKLRQKYKIEELYLDYRLYTPNKTIDKCKLKCVTLNLEDGGVFNLIPQYVKSDTDRSILQYIVNCPCRQVVVPIYPELYDHQLHTLFGIHVVSSINEAVVFKRTTDNKYELLDWFEDLGYMTPDLTRFYDELLMQPPPTSINDPAEVQSIFFNKIKLISRVLHNIVSFANKYIFASLCKMSLRTSVYKFTVSTESILMYGKPNGIIVNILLDRIGFTRSMLVYPCYGNAADSLLTLGLDVTTYVLLPGHNVNAVIVLKKFNSSDGRTFYIPMELIENVFIEFLHKI